jgi:hypothetical protein
LNRVLKGQVKDFSFKFSQRFQYMVWWSLYTLNNPLSPGKNQNNRIETKINEFDKKKLDK